MQDIKEKIAHGSKNFPIAFYHVDKKHPRYIMKVHWHYEFEILRILDGELHIHLDSECYYAKKDDIFLINSGVVHSAIPKDCVYECLVFDFEALMSKNDICKDEIYNLLSGYILPRNPVKITNKAVDILNQLYSAMKNETSQKGLQVKGLLFLFFAEILNQEEIFLKRKNKLINLSKQTAFKNVISYIESNYTEQITLQKLAAIANMSPNYFCRFFKKITGYTPIDYIIHFKIETASELLLNSSLSVTDIAFSCGFKDISYFINAFKKEKGLTPLKFKKEKKKTVS